MCCVLLNFKINISGFWVKKKLFFGEMLKPVGFGVTIFYNIIYRIILSPNCHRVWLKCVFKFLQIERQGVTKEKKILLISQKTILTFSAEESSLIIAAVCSKSAAKFHNKYFRIWCEKNYFLEQNVLNEYDLESLLCTVSAKEIMPSHCNRVWQKCNKNLRTPKTAYRVTKAMLNPSYAYNNRDRV